MSDRVLAHAHSSWSYDGTLSLDAWRDIAHARRCQAVLFAEHEESGWSADRFDAYVAECARASDRRVRLVPGVEFSQDGRHVLCYGLTHWIARPSSIDALARAAHAQGCILCLAHPTRYRWSYPACLLEGIDAVEAWNSSWVCDGSLGPHPRTLALAGARVLLVGQDVHKRAHLGGLYLRTEGPDPVAALRTGDFAIEHRGRVRAREHLHERPVRGLIQRARTRSVWAALATYRSTRRLARRLADRGRRAAEPGASQ